ncbi:MAG: IgGFc-binding protein [Bacteroidota bacterium]|nr:IgGFc-binding protein [Bacteroidota bacterium]MDP4232399.1 IgGFc-binding protein [Bacteroidota bacterium]MDP4241536.1 IgGFc-binding protein [Bacteroidota bacterium]MDP4288270.1 IgGFc-binding protein [Bacteroidota bacterium]
MKTHPSPSFPHFGLASLGIALLSISAIQLLSLGSIARAQCNTMVEPPTSIGTEFLLCFERNVDANREDLDSGYCEIDLASLDQAATVTITSRHYPGMSQVFQLPPRTSKVWRVTDLWPDLWITSADSIEDRVVKVTSSSPIACYGQNHKAQSADGFLALPISSCGSEYRVMSYGNSDYTTAVTMMPSQFAVAAFTPSTITITPSAPTATGHPAGAPFTVTLDAGQCIQIQTDGTVIGQDLTGSIVTASGGSKIAVFGSHARTELPTRFQNSLFSTSRDHLAEQLPPIGAWGSNFVLAPIQVDASSRICPDGDNVRVLALNNNTVVTVNGNPWVTLAANQWADSLFLNPLVISASGGPILVGQYAHSNLYNGDDGDPFLAIVPPVEQSYNDYTFFASEDNAYSVQKVIVAADTAAQNSIVFDGAPLSSSFFIPMPISIGTNSYGYTELTVTPGAHRISCNQSDGFTILSYGLGFVISYGYTAGALLKPLRAVFVQPQPTIIGSGSATPDRTSSNRVHINNVLTDPVYLDQADFIPDNPDDASYDIHFVEQLDPISGQLDPGETSTLHLACQQQLDKPITGTIKIYAHAFNWHDLEPAQQAWTFFPNTAADVQAGTANAIDFRNAPNPFGTVTTIAFNMPEMADVTLTLTDELGRCVRTIAQGPFQPGHYDIRLDRHELPNGCYHCNLRAPKLGIDRTITILAVE